MSTRLLFTGAVFLHAVISDAIIRQRSACSFCWPWRPSRACTLKTKVSVPAASSGVYGDVFYVFKYSPKLLPLRGSILLTRFHEWRIPRRTSPEQQEVSPLHPQRAARHFVLSGGTTSFRGISGVP